MKHWRLEEADNSRILTIDVEGKGANVLSYEVIEELNQCLDQVETALKSDEEPKGLIIRSGKGNGFIFGADINEFLKIKDAQEGAELAGRGQAVMNRIENLKCPTVAIINGNCMGGGTELILACDYRIALDDARTRIALPEVNLGINPGFGGTVRLPKLIGLPSLNMMLTGRPVSARAAKRLGLVDDAVPERYLMRAAEMLVTRRPKKHRPKFFNRVPNMFFLRPIVAHFARKQIAQRARPDQYPAPYRILQLWTRGASQRQEAESLGELMMTEASHSLVHVYQLSDKLKRLGRGTPHNIQHVHVIGAGVMGGDIASWAAFKGFHVTLQDLNEEVLAKAIKRAYKLYKKKLKKPELIQEVMDRLMPDVRGDGLRKADIVIEAIVEKLEVKQKVFADVETKVGEHTILATNTSSIPLEEISEKLKDPGRLVGIHFFNPVAKMQLVEVVHGTNTAPEILGRARSFTAALARLPLDVKSSPGFLVNRILMPYLMEAMAMVEEGTPLADIDRAALDFGMPMGPIHLADTVGLDICLSVAEELAGPLGLSVPEKLREMVAAGKLGKKSGEGFYQYDKSGNPVRGNGSEHGTAIADRLILRQLNEAIACLREGVVSDADAVDAGMVYGTGFAPFRGGPMRYVEKLGVSEVSHSMHRMVEAYGSRFEPDVGWDQGDLLKRSPA